MSLSWSPSDSHFNGLFSFHNQKTNKIFYHLLGRLDVFLFISSCSGSIKFPLPFSFYNAGIGILFFSFFMIFFFPVWGLLFFFGPISPACCCCCMWCEVQGNRERRTEGHVFAGTHGWQGEVLNKKRSFFQCRSPLWEHWSLWWWRSGCAGLGGKYSWDFLCGFFPRIHNKNWWTHSIVITPLHSELYVFTPSFLL